MNDLKQQANIDYYNTGEPLLTDHEFDLLSDDGLETKNFRVKTDHYQPMGSLKKVKTKEDFDKWLKGQGTIWYSPKLDGNSVEIVLDGYLVQQGITRGDGFVGNDITDKVHFCNLPAFFYSDGKSSVKCEAIMPKTYQGDYDKNLRNVVAGVIGRKSVQKDELRKVDIIPFSILTRKMFEPSYEKLQGIFEELKKNYPYEIDGLVVEHIKPIHEDTNPLLPENTIALKFNKTGVDAIIGWIEWNLGKYGRLTPVLVLLDGIDIDGTTVKRVSASNYGLVVEAGLWPGAEVQVIKSGDIIPYISAVISRSDNDLPVICPECGNPARISENGIHAICDHCKDDGLTYLKHVFEIFDLEFISNSTVEKLFNAGCTNLEDYFLLTVNDITKIDGFGKSKASNIVSKLKSISLTEAQVLKAAMVEGMGEKQCQKLIDYFGDIKTFLGSDQEKLNISGIDGFGDILADRIQDNFWKFIDTYKLLSLYCRINSGKSGQLDHLGNVVCTGKYEKYGRKELSGILEGMGYTIQDSVNKETTILITSDPNSNSGKTKKAKQLGIKIVTYTEFFE